MLPWVFVVLLALNLALFLWGHRNQHLREPPLPPVPESRYEMLLLSEIEQDPPAWPLGSPGAAIPSPEAASADPAAWAADRPEHADPAALQADVAPDADLIEPAGTDDDAWVERELTGGAGAQPASPPQPSFDALPIDKEVPLDDQATSDGRTAADDAAPKVPEPRTDDAAPPTPDQGPEPATAPTPDQGSDPLDSTPAVDLPPIPELPNQQRRTPGSVNPRIESTV